MTTNKMKSNRNGIAPLELVIVLPLLVTLLVLLNFVAAASMQQMAFANQTRHETWQKRHEGSPAGVKPLVLESPQGQLEKTATSTVKTGLFFDKWKLGMNSHHTVFPDTWDYRTTTTKNSTVAMATPSPEEEKTPYKVSYCNVAYTSEVQEDTRSLLAAQSGSSRIATDHAGGTNNPMRNFGVGGCLLSQFRRRILILSRRLQTSNSL